MSRAALALAVASLASGCADSDTGIEFEIDVRGLRVPAELAAVDVTIGPYGRPIDEDAGIGLHRTVRLVPSDAGADAGMDAAARGWMLPFTIGVVPAGGDENHAVEARVHAIAGPAAGCDLADVYRVVRFAHGTVQHKRLVLGTGCCGVHCAPGQVCDGDTADGQCVAAVEVTGTDFVPEVCNDLDDDHDGVVDTFFEPCHTTCGPGTRECLAGAWGACVPDPTLPVGPFYRDADGDGFVAMVATGAQTHCSDPGWVTVPPARAGECDDTNPAVHPGAAETCNGIDDDCNGMVDEALTRTCHAVCGGHASAPCVSGDCNAPAHQQCVAGAWGACTPDSLGSEAAFGCNGWDENCNGAADEGLCSGGLVCQRVIADPAMFVCCDLSSAACTILPMADSPRICCNAGTICPGGLTCQRAGAEGCGFFPGTCYFMACCRAPP